MGKPKACKYCGRTDVPLSKRGLCVTCARKRVQENIQQLIEKKGPYYEKWHAALLQSLKGGE